MNFYSCLQKLFYPQQFGLSLDFIAVLCVNGLLMFLYPVRLCVVKDKCSSFCQPFEAEFHLCSI
jgi:hypothetical protein